MAAPYVYRPAPRFPSYFGIAILLAISLPVAVMQPDRLLSADGLSAFLCPLLFAAPIAVFLRNRFEITRTADGRAIRIVAYLWLRAPVETLHSLDELVGADVERGSGRGGPAWRVVLTFANGELVPLTTSYAGGSSHEQAAAAIRAMIAGGTAPA